MKILVRGGQFRSSTSLRVEAWICLGCGIALGTILTLATMGVLR